MNECSVFVTILDHFTLSGIVSTSSFDSFQQSMKSLFVSNKQGNFIKDLCILDVGLWKYKDNERDWCILSDNAEWEAMMSLVEKNSNQPLELFVDISQCLKKEVGEMAESLEIVSLKEIESWNETNLTDELVFYVNNRMHKVSNPDPEMKLVTYIRDVLNLKGTKIGCFEGGCGACSILLSWIDSQSQKEVHVAVNACSYPLCAVDGKHITTVEGVGTKNDLHPIQKALSDGSGTQCGFCTPGFVMSMYELLRNNPNPSEKEIEEHFDGNLCRCTGYRPILESFKKFASSSSENVNSSNDSHKHDHNHEKEEVCRTDCGDNCACKAEGKFDLEEIFALYSAPQSFPSETKPAEVESTSQTTKSGFLPPALKFFSPSPAQFSKNGILWLRPVSLTELCSIQQKYCNESIKYVVGNTGFSVEQCTGRVNYSVYCDIRTIPDFQVRASNDAGITVGASVSLSSLMGLLMSQHNGVESAYDSAYTVLHRTLQSLATVQVRNVASWAGNLMLAWKNAHFTSDLLSVLCSLGAKVKYYKEGHVSAIPIEGLLKMDSKGVILINLFIPSLVSSASVTSIVNSYRVSRRRQNAHAVVSGAFAMKQNKSDNKLSDVHICYTGATDGLMRCYYAENALNGKTEINTTVVQDVMKALVQDFNLSGPSSRWDFTPEYRLSLVQGFAYRFLCYALGNRGSCSIQKLGEHYDRPVSHGSQILTRDPSEKPLSYPLKKLSSDIQTTGEAKFTQDLKFPKDTAIAVFVRNYDGIGVLDSLDISEAKSSHGVIDVLTAKDIDGANQGGFFEDEPVLTVIGKPVEFIGQALALVVAETIEDAVVASGKVKFTLSDRHTPVVSMEEAIKKKMFIHSPMCPEKVTKGDINKGFAEADQVISGSVKAGLQKHFYMETQNCVAVPTEDDGVVVHASVQSPWSTANIIAKNLKLPEHQVSVKMLRAGGGFGGKLTRGYIVHSAAALAAVKTQRAVKLSLWRQEDLDVIGARAPMRLVYKAGVKNDGTITAMQAHYFLEAGAYTDFNLMALSVSPLFGDNAYFIPNWYITQQAVKTHMATNTAMRGPTRITVAMQMETVIDHIARGIKVDPSIVRAKNLYKAGDLTPMGDKMWPEITVKRVFDGILKKSNYNELRKETDAFNKENKYIKRGMSMMMMKYGIERDWRRSFAQLRIYPDGSIGVTHNGCEIGQGLNVKVAQTCAYVLDVPIELIRFTGPDTSRFPAGSDTGGSATAENCSKAMGMAATQMRDRLKCFRSKTKTWADAIAAATAVGTNLETTGWFAPLKNQDGHFDYFIFGGSVSQVEVNMLSGEHTILKTEILYDCGVSLNPLIDAGQIEGAFMQGVGYLFHEESIPDPETGRLLTDTTWDYKIPSSLDIPLELDVSLLDDAPNSHGVYNSKATGEAPYILSASAFLAVKDAIMACRTDHGKPGHFDFNWPATVDKIQRASLVNPSKFTV